ncbi:MAG TPA: cytidylate kinase family protein [Candidatus Acidoferrum sp.]|nr:cytidylate kinase family protein [Candidatus Acidoferrum sp.]
MSVITISRGSFSGGKTLAECLARRLGYRCIDRDVIVERAAAYGVSQQEIRDALEKPPNFLDRFKHKRYLYLVLVQAALAEEVRTGKAIYHGLAGHLLLKGGQPILRTRIIAPMEFRIQMVQARLKYSQREAIAYIEKVDEDRRKWTQFLYGVDWGDPSLYDIVLNLEHIDIEEACHIISSMVIERCFEFTPECQQKMDDLALASRVRADLAVSPSTSDLEVEVVAHGGAVAIQGRLTSIDRLEEVARIARAVPGVTALDLEKLSPSVRV